MDLIKKNIHMDRMKTGAVSQFTLEDDVNIPDVKPDVGSLNLEKGNLVMEEVRPGTDFITVRGRMDYAVLYHTAEEGGRLVLLTGSIPFEEKVNMQGVTSADQITAQSMIEDLSVGLINSRKLSIQAVVSIQAWVEEICDEEIPIDLHGEDVVEYRSQPLNICQIAICKKDIYRVKEEICLPSGYPNLFQILWDNVSLGDVEFRMMEEQLQIQGDIHFFVLYEGEGENRPIRSWETTIPFNGTLECHGCRENMIPDIDFALSSQEISIRPDLDGEERCLGLDLTMDIDIHLYEEEETRMISDAYGVSKEVECSTHPVKLRQLLSAVTGKTKVTDHLRVESGMGSILQLLHSEGDVTLDRQRPTENGIQVQGSVSVKVLYITGDDEDPYRCLRGQIPYDYTLEIPGMDENTATEDRNHVRASLEQLQVTMLDGEEMEVKAVIAFRTTVFRTISMETIEQLKVSDLDSEKQSSLPGMVIYRVQPGDNLWNIGRKYYVSVDHLRERNGLTTDEVTPGQKLLIVKAL